MALVCIVNIVIQSQKGEYQGKYVANFYSCKDEFEMVANSDEIRIDFGTIALLIASSMAAFLVVYLSEHEAKCAQVEESLLTSCNKVDQQADTRMRSHGCDSFLTANQLQFVNRLGAWKLVFIHRRATLNKL